MVMFLKYGITLDQSATSGGTEYVDSSDTTFWSDDTNDIYEHDIFGIGRDDSSELDQRIARSQNADDIVTLSMNNDFVTDNQDSGRTSHDNNYQFLTLANNDGLYDLQTSELEGGTFNQRIEREWFIQKTANFTSQNVNMKFDGFDDDYHLLMDADGDFSSGFTDLGELDVNGEITGVDLFNTQYLTLATEISGEQNLTFIFNQNESNFGSLTTAESRYATPTTGSSTPFPAHNLIASTNASGGYVIEIDGTTLIDTNGNEIDAIGGTPQAQNPGTEQFGLSAQAIGSGASMSAPYNTSNFAYDSVNFPDQFAVGLGDDSTDVYQIEYLGNIDPLTPAGEYEAVITYTMHATFN